MPYFKFPRALTCEAALRKRRDLTDPQTKVTGSCGQCRRCWRLFLWCRREMGLKGTPKWVNGKFAGWENAKARPKWKAEVPA